MDGAREIDGDAGMSAPENRGIPMQMGQSGVQSAEMGSKSSGIARKFHYLKTNRPVASLLLGFSEHP